MRRGLRRTGKFDSIDSGLFLLLQKFCEITDILCNVIVYRELEIHKAKLKSIKKTKGSQNVPNANG